MRTDLLTDLANHLEKNVGEADFNIFVFAGEDEGPRCALCHAADVPSIKEAGLSMVDGFPTYKGRHCFDVLGELFEIKTTDMLWLFTWSHNNLKKSDVVRRLREFVSPKPQGD